MIVSPALRQYFTGVLSLFSDYINKWEGMNHIFRNISEVSYGSGRGGSIGRGRGHGGQGGQVGRGGYKRPPQTAKEISACTHMSDHYFSDKNYKYLSPAGKSRLCQMRKKRTEDEYNPSTPPSIINQVKRKIS